MHRRATAAERYAEVDIGKRAFLPGRTRSPAADEGDHVFPQPVGKKFRWTEPLLGRWPAMGIESRRRRVGRTVTSRVCWSMAVALAKLPVAYENRL